MNRKTLIILLTLVVLIVGSVTTFALTRPASDASTASTSSDGTSSGGSSGQAAASTERYVDYSPSAIANAEGTTLLFFHATWCPSCRQIESEILEKGVPAGVTIIKVDYDTHQDLRQKYGVTVQTTFVSVDASGEQIASFVPYGNDLSLKSVLDELA